MVLCPIKGDHLALQAKANSKVRKFVCSLHVTKIDLSLAQWFNKAIDISIVSSKYALYIINSVYRCCPLCYRFKLVKVCHYLCLVWRSNIESSNIYAAQRLNRLFQLSL